jgi:hypothetical protein
MHKVCAILAIELINITSLRVASVAIVRGIHVFDNFIFVCMIINIEQNQH